MKKSTENWGCGYRLRVIHKNIDCTTASAHHRAVSSLQPLPTAQGPRLEIRLLSAAAGRLPPARISAEGRPFFQDQPHWEGVTPKRRSPHTARWPGPLDATSSWSSMTRWSSSKARPRAAPAWVGPGGGRRRRVAVPSPASKHQRRLRYCCIVLHHGEGTVSHPSCQKKHIPAQINPTESIFLLRWSTPTLALCSVCGLAFNWKNKSTRFPYWSPQH